jgi:hypothetical protein
MSANPDPVSAPEAPQPCDPGLVAGAGLGVTAADPDPELDPELAPVVSAGSASHPLALALTCVPLGHASQLAAPSIAE